MIRYHRVDKNRPPMFFALTMVALLVGCGEGTDALNSGLIGVDAIELGAASPELGSPPTQISPSVSAAQLLNDKTLTVGMAQAVAAGELVLPSETSQNIIAEQTSTDTESTPTESVATPTIDEATDTTSETDAVVVAPVVTPVAETTSPNLGAAIPTESVDEEEEAVAEQTPSVPETSTDAADSGDLVETESETLAETDIETETTSDASTETETEEEPETSAAEPAVVEQNSTAQTDENFEAQTQFVGSTSPTFMGEIQEDGSVLLDWDVDPTARGYNVYRDAEYIATVFENTYTDAFETFDRNYYYEIQAFTVDEIYTTIATGLTVQISGTGRTDPNDPLPEEGLLDDYELVFSDEFNGDNLDTSKWNTAYLWGDDLIINSELQHYVDIANDPTFGFNPFTFDGESLTINTVRTPPELLEKANGQAYLSGVITSYDAFKFTYGYVEARAKVPFGKGYWPAFWLLNAYYDLDKPEIDIMEFIGDNQDTVYHTYHYYDEEGNLRSTKSEPTYPIDFSANFHTFGAEWSPGTVTFYVDGIARHTISDPKMSQEQMYIIANTAVGGWWPGDPDENTKFPGEYKIDYIRAYQRVGVQLDPPMFANPDSEVPVRADEDFSTPGHLPPFELFPEGYPEL